ncbi:MAG: 50S ribosomal protein L3 [Parcubacteria group bacterium]|nr:50S ribosomal protein L3 [Parcubacteria group bacterium]|tara:strand:- start:25421 stop:26266 length:846 start_codon:yes stop_codon:yes gene_type:complete
MKFILAEKKEMTQKFEENGTVIPVTKVIANPCVVTQLKDIKKDGYTAVQIGFGSKRNLSKSVKGHLKNLGNFRYLKEFKISDEDAKKLAVGNKITVNIFQSGDKVKVSGTSKGKGFQGVVKRHGFHGSLASHGHKDQLRMPGSIGATGPAHVFKGKKMPGQMGNSQVTVTNLEIVEIDSDKNEIFIKGAVPGARNNLLLISGVGDLVIEEEKSVDDSGNRQETTTENEDKDTKDSVEAKKSPEVESSKKEDEPIKDSVEKQETTEVKAEEKKPEAKIEASK